MDIRAGENYYQSGRSCSAVAGKYNTSLRMGAINNFGEASAIYGRSLCSFLRVSARRVSQKEQYTINK